MKSESAVTVLEPGLRRILAPNPSPMTYKGTNTYLVGEGDLVVIDPGPKDQGHLSSILNALEPGERIAAILVTHSHMDHSPLARPLAEATSAPVLAAGPSDWGRSEVMARLARDGLLGGGEGVDAGFSPDDRIREGSRIDGAWGAIEVLETPGHMANHLSFAWNGALFSGDLVMGWSTSLVSPPDGDMTAFMASLRRLEGRSDRIYYAGHGDPVDDPQDRARALIAHRAGREGQILDALGHDAPASAADLAARIYTDLAPALLPAAQRNVLAHLIDLTQRNQISPDGPLGATARFART